MFEFMLFASTCAVMAFLLANIHKQLTQPKTKLQPIRIKQEKKHPLSKRKHQQ
ncbi:hypothetical protein [Marinomonas epiphytica]